jgi:Flp pilus assembly pilin Flp
MLIPQLCFASVRSLFHRACEAITRFLLHRTWSEDRGQDIAEYAVMLAAILVIVVGTLRLIGANANSVASSLQ